jgi:hypothetical protein
MRKRHNSTLQSSSVPGRTERRMNSCDAVIAARRTDVGEGARDDVTWHSSRAFDFTDKKRKGRTRAVIPRH